MTTLLVLSRQKLTSSRRRLPFLFSAIVQGRAYLYYPEDRNIHQTVDHCYLLYSTAAVDALYSPPPTVLLVRSKNRKRGK